MIFLKEDKNYVNLVYLAQWKIYNDIVPSKNVDKEKQLNQFVLFSLLCMCMHVYVCVIYVMSLTSEYEMRKTNQNLQLVLLIHSRINIKGTVNTKCFSSVDKKIQKCNTESSNG